jgi:hypothetical protein
MLDSSLLFAGFLDNEMVPYYPSKVTCFLKIIPPQTNDFKHI